MSSKSRILTSAYCYSIRYGKVLYIFLAHFQKESVMGDHTDKDINTEKPRTSKVSQRGRFRQTAWEKRKQGAGDVRSLIHIGQGGPWPSG